jgi:hypothetical protein
LLDHLVLLESFQASELAPGVSAWSVVQILVEGGELGGAEWSAGVQDGSWGEGIAVTTILLLGKLGNLSLVLWVLYSAVEVVEQHLVVLVVWLGVHVLLVAAHEVVLLLPVVLVVVVVVDLGVDHLVVLGVVQGDLQVLLLFIIALSIAEVEISESPVRAGSGDGWGVLSYLWTSGSFLEVKLHFWHRLLLDLFSVVVLNFGGHYDLVASLQTEGALANDLFLGLDGSLVGDDGTLGDRSAAASSLASLTEWFGLWSLLIVSLQVCPQISAFRKSPLAFVAFVRSFTSVSSQVDLKRAGSHEFVTAVLALVWSLARVSSFVVS